MADPLQPVKPGDRLRIPAAAYNAFCEAARAQRAGVRRGGRPGDPGAGPGLLVPVRNDSGGACGRYAVLGLAGVLVAPEGEDLEKFLGGPVWSCITPVAPDHRGLFVVLQDAIDAGGVGWACAAGLTPVPIAVTDEDHRFADISDGSSAALASVPSGAARILYRETGTGTKWAVVLVGSWGPPPAEDDYAVPSWSEADGAYVSGPVRAM